MEILKYNQTYLVFLGKIKFFVSKWNARPFRPFSSSFSSLYLSFDFFFIMVSLFYLNISNISEDISLLNFVYGEIYIFKMTVKFLT